MTTDPTSGHQDARTNAQQGTGSAGQKNPYFDFTGYQLRMPKTWPTSVREVLPTLRRDELSRITRTDHMPMDARIGYWIWLVGCVLTIIGWFLSISTILVGILFNPIILVGTGMVSLWGNIRWGVILFYIASMLLSLAIMLVQLCLTLKIRERAEWARAGLTAITVVSIIYSMILTAADLESGGGGTVAVSIISLALVAFFWLPKANFWFLGSADSSDATEPGSSPRTQ